MQWNRPVRSAWYRPDFALLLTSELGPERGRLKTTSTLCTFGRAPCPWPCGWLAGGRWTLLLCDRRVVNTPSAAHNDRVVAVVVAVRRARSFILPRRARESEWGRVRGGELCLQQLYTWLLAGGEGRGEQAEQREGGERGGWVGEREARAQWWTCDSVG